MDNRITRASTRAKKLSKPMKVVNEQVRQVVKQTRIDKLEEDNLFSLDAFEKPEGEDFHLDSDNEELFSMGINPKKRKKKDKGRHKEADTKRAKHTHRPKINILKILSPELYDLKGKVPNYMTMRASPSPYPPHKYCSVCGFTYKYKCPRCGMLYCSANCFKTHRDTVCIRFGT